MIGMSMSGRHKHLQEVFYRLGQVNERNVTCAKCSDAPDVLRGYLDTQKEIGDTYSE